MQSKKRKGVESSYSDNTVWFYWKLGKGDYCLESSRSNGKQRYINSKWLSQLTKERKRIKSKQFGSRQGSGFVAPVDSAVLMQACCGICPVTRGLRGGGRMQQAGNSPVGETLLRSGESCCVGVANAFVGLMRNSQAVLIEQLRPFRNPLPSSGHGRSRAKLRLKKHKQARQQDLFLLQVAGQGWASAGTHTTAKHVGRGWRKQEKRSRGWTWTLKLNSSTSSCEADQGSGRSLTGATQAFNNVKSKSVSFEHFMMRGKSLQFTFSQ